MNALPRTGFAASATSQKSFQFFIFALMAATCSCFGLQTASGQSASLKNGTVYVKGTDQPDFIRVVTYVSTVEVHVFTLHQPLPFPTSNLFSFTPRNQSGKAVVETFARSRVQKIDVDSLEGDDVIYTVIAESSRLVGGDGSDVIFGSAQSFETCLIYGDGVSEREGDDDIIFGSQSDDVIFGGGGNDVIIGYGGQDFVSGDDGDDYLDGSYDSYVDLLYGGRGRDDFYSEIDPNSKQNPSTTWNRVPQDTILDFSFGDQWHYQN